MKTEDHDWLDTMLDAGASFDWITPALGLLSGRPVLAVPQESMTQTRTILQGAEIRIYQDQIFDGRYVFHVDAKDMDTAVMLLGGTRQTGSNVGAWLLALLILAIIVALVAI